MSTDQAAHETTMSSRRPAEVALAALAGVLLTASVVGWLGARGDRGETARPSGGTAVTVVDFAYQPTPLTVTAGDTVTWTNEDDAAHTVTSDGDGPLTSGEIAGGGTFEHTFDQPGTYEYVCTFHPTMMGTIEVSRS